MRERNQPVMPSTRIRQDAQAGDFLDVRGVNDVQSGVRAVNNAPVAQADTMQPGRHSESPGLR
jgi:arginine utilization protein RocB